MCMSTHFNESNEYKPGCILNVKFPHYSGWFFEDRVVVSLLSESIWVGESAGLTSTGAQWSGGGPGLLSLICCCALPTCLPCMCALSFPSLSYSQGFSSLLNPLGFLAWQHAGGTAPHPLASSLPLLLPLKAKKGQVGWTQGWPRELIRGRRGGWLSE